MSGIGVLNGNLKSSLVRGGLGVLSKTNSLHQVSFFIVLEKSRFQKKTCLLGSQKESHAMSPPGPRLRDY